MLPQPMIRIDFMVQNKRGPPPETYLVLLVTRRDHPRHYSNCSFASEP
jgi:hypothetical protein